VAPGPKVALSNTKASPAASPPITAEGIVFVSNSSTPPEPAKVRLPPTEVAFPTVTVPPLITALTIVPPNSVSRSPPEPTVVEMALARFSVISVPPLRIVVALAVATLFPSPTICRPPPLIVVLTAMPAAVMFCSPPLLMIVLLTVPAPVSKFPTVCSPPLLIVVLIAVPVLVNTPLTGIPPAIV
jgi:hypothetical protein